MTKKTRLMILLFCIVCFFVVAPILVAYSMGYRFDFEKMKVAETGGIYVRTFPSADQIVIDSKPAQKPGMFSNAIFVQSLLPKNHTVSIKKSGYYDYSKILPVQEKQVTKLENVLLIKKTIAFNDIADKIDYFSVAPNNQNIIVATFGAKNITFSYFSLNNISQQKTFSIAQAGKTSAIKWSDDSSKALIKIDGTSNTFYYYLDTALQKLSAIRLTYLDKNSEFISFNPQDSQTIFFIKNKTLYSAKGNSALPVINNIISFKASGANITWLSARGALSASDLTGKLISKTTSKDFPIDSKQTYEIVSVSQNTFLKSGNALFRLNQETKTFKNFIIPAISDYKILTSPDGKNLIYWSKEKIYLYSLDDKKFTEIFSVGPINYCQWLNNDYIVFSSGDKIIISEIDYRGNINTVDFSAKLNTGSGKTIELKDPQIFYNQQDGKIYVLTQNTLLSSEKIIP